MEDQENIIQSTTELPRSNITEVKKSRHVAVSKTTTSPKKTGGLKETVNKDNTRVEKLVDSKALHRPFNAPQVKSGIAVYKEEKKLDVQKKKTKEDAIVKKKEVKTDAKTKVVSADEEELKQELNQDIENKAASISSKILEKEKLDQSIKDTETKLKEMKALTAREKEAVDELKEQVEELETADKEVDEMIASLDQVGTAYELKRQEKQQSIDNLLNTLSELKYEISELKGEP